MIQNIENKEKKDQVGYKVDHLSAERFRKPAYQVNAFKPVFHTDGHTMQSALCAMLSIDRVTKKGPLIVSDPLFTFCVRRRNYAP